MADEPNSMGSCRGKLRLGDLFELSDDLVGELGGCGRSLQVTGSVLEENKLHF